MLKEIIQYRLHQMSEQIHLLKTTSPKPVNPKSPEWTEYKNLKHQVSHWLTALKILKHWGGKIPSKENFRKVLRQNAVDWKGPSLFQQHLPNCMRGKENHIIDRAKMNSLIFGSYYALLELEKEYKADPTKFADAEAYAQTREQEVAHAKSGCN